MKIKIAVYGTLRKGGKNEQFLNQSTFLGKAQLAGYLLFHKDGGSFNYEDYPSILTVEDAAKVFTEYNINPNRKYKVTVEIYEVDDADIKNIFMIESDYIPRLHYISYTPAETYTDTLEGNATAKSKALVMLFTKTATDLYKLNIIKRRAYKWVTGGDWIKYWKDFMATKSTPIYKTQ